jgi:PST family polysaccharide transporter
MEQENLRHKKLAVNTVFLYILSFSNQLIGLLTVPYLTRVLGPTVYGKLGVALSLMVYIQLILDFGFLLSATEIISKNQESNDICSKVFSAVMTIKGFLAVITGGVFALICYAIPTWREDIILYLIFYIAYCINAFLPDFVYRGKEEMKMITIRTVGVKIIFTLLIFIFVRTEMDLIKYPIILGLGNLIAVIWSFINIYQNYNIRFHIVSVSFIKMIFSSTIAFFASRIATTFYQAATTVILGILYANQPVVGYYSSVDKLMSATKSFSSPVADSLYPYMSKNKDYKLIKKILFIISPIIAIAGIITFVFAEKICVIIFGREYREAANILRCMIPAMMVIFPTYIMSFPVLSPLGLSKYANLSNILGACLQVVLVAVLWLINKLNVYSLCICGSISEVTVFVFRCMVAFINRSKMNVKNMER